MNGADLVRQITLQNKEVQCMICSIFDDDAFVFKALKNGALGYLLKDSTSDQIITALIELRNGGSPMSTYIARKVIGSFRTPEPTDAVSLLSDRENEVLNLISEGLIYKEIADRLFISPETVRKHVRNVYRKLHVQNKIEALNKLRDS
jgi:DNA-binding NarL/FixJ family response regulator